MLPPNRLSLICFAVYFTASAGSAFGQASPTPDAAITQIDLYVKIFGAVLTALATLFGLPIVFLTYKKTRSEIAKLELESATLREKLPSDTERTRPDQNGIQINVANSPNVHVEVLADPRFLAPLLLLVDFIFAWLVLTLASYLLDIFDFGSVRTVALAILAAVLLLPIAKQVIRVRAVLRPPRSADEIRTSIRQAKVATYVAYALMILVPFMFGTLLLVVEPSRITNLGRYLAWSLVVLGSVLVLLIPIIKPRIDRYLSSLVESKTY